MLQTPNFSDLRTRSRHLPESNPGGKCLFVCFGFLGDSALRVIFFTVEQHSIFCDSNTVGWLSMELV